jgi:hypothetical protein
MALIYRDAFVTISAISSVSCQESFLVRNRRLLELEFRSRVASEVTGRFSLVASGICRDWVLHGWPGLDTTYSRLQTRGWTLQEEQCSTRMLLFGKSMIHFQCSHITSKNGIHEYYGSKILNSLSELELDITPGSLADFYDYWRQMLSEYCSRHFTDPEDCLPGLSGIARLVAETTGDQYLAGIWKDDLAAALIWHPWVHQAQEYHIELWELVKKLSNPVPYVAPTWSPLRLRGLWMEDGLRFHKPRSSSWKTESDLIEAQINVNGLNPFGKIQHGSMRLKGKLNKLKSSINMVPYWYTQPKLWYSRHEDRGGCLVYYNLDWDPIDAKVVSTELFMLMTASTTGTESVQDFIQYKNFGCDCNVESSSAYDSHESSDRSNVENGADIENLDLGSGDLMVDYDADSHISQEDNKHDVSNSDHPVGLIGDDRDAWGLLLHPARETGKYPRVGVWASIFADSGGIHRKSKLFRHRTLTQSMNHMS